MKFSATLIYILLSLKVLAQSPIDTTYFNSPMNIPLISAGTFGELRDNHFHAGLDLKTQFREGIPVQAAADGYVSRIRVGVWGYGKAIYVDHPNGYTTVYAHLSKFSPELETYIKNLQYKRKSHEVQGFPKKEEFHFKKGEIIAYSGATGGFVGPHLHFEIRDTQTEHILNPMLFGIVVKDGRPPSALALQVKPADSTSQINGFEKRIKLNFWEIKKDQFQTDTVEVFGSALFQVQSIDRQDAANNKNGLYEISLFENDRKVYNHTLNEFSFSESKLINLLIDYEYYQLTKKRFQQLYIPSNSNLSIYNRKLKDTSKKEDFSMYKIELNDFQNNNTSIYIPVIYVNKPKSLVKSLSERGNYHIKREEFYKIENHNAFISLQKETFYQDLSLNLKLKKDSIFIDHDRYPLNKKMTIGFKLAKTNINQKGIALLKDGKLKFIETEYLNETLVAHPRTLGTYILAEDKVSPYLKSKNFSNKSWISKHKTLELTVLDEQSGLKSFEANLDGNWIALEYNPKTNTISYDLKDIPLEKGEHKLEIIIEDLVGNQTFKSYLLYKG